MSKLGVGVGEDFPVDDGKPTDRGAPPGGPDDDDRKRDDRYFYGTGADYEARRAAHRVWRRQRKEWRRQWRDEWKARKRAFRDQVHQSVYENMDDGHDRWRYRGLRGLRFPFFGPPLLLSILVSIAAVMLLVFVFQHVFMLFGFATLVLLFFAYHYTPNFFDHHDAMPGARRSPPPQETPRDAAN